ncbi:MAG: hypothetical protein ACXWTS_09990 [Methylococcaceae bacterium]
MLKFPCRLSILLLLQGTALLATAGPLLEKVTYPGFVMPAYAVSTRCTLNEDGLMVIQYQLGSLKSQRKQVLQLSTASIKQAIDIASLAPVTSGIFPVDAGTQIYRAFQKKPGGGTKSILLWEQNGGSGEEKINGSSEALMLRNFIDLNCGHPSLQ